MQPKRKERKLLLLRRVKSVNVKILINLLKRTISYTFCTVESHYTTRLMERWYRRKMESALEEFVRNFCSNLSFLRAANVLQGGKSHLQGIVESKNKSQGQVGSCKTSFSEICTPSTLFISQLLEPSGEL